MKRLFMATIGFLSALTLTSCASNQQDAWRLLYEQEKAARRDQEARIRNLEAQQRQQQAAPQPPRPQQVQPQQRRLTRAETMEFCEKVHESREIPVHCSLIKLKDGTPLMSFTFVNMQTMNAWWGAITEQFAFEYCRQSNAMNITSGVTQHILDINKIRVWDCEAGKWSEWGDSSPQHNRTQSPNLWRY
jgi:hypothetical protein